MDFERVTPVIVRGFHYDLNEKPESQNEVNVAIKKVNRQLEDGTTEADPRDGGYYEIGVVFEVAPMPGDFTVSGLITQIVQLKDYHGKGDDLKSNDYKILSRPLVEYIETLTYEVTQVTLDKPVNLNFKANFD